MIVEVGCGDFFVGIQLVAHCDRYVACDIAKQLIEWNRQRYTDAKLSFHELDAVRDEFLKGDVLIIRQVLQHLLNEDIIHVLPKLSQLRQAIITEHLPDGASFPPNLNKPTGVGTRLNRSSGVVLTAAPCTLPPISESILCEVPEAIGRVRTVADTLSALC